MDREYVADVRETVHDLESLSALYEADGRTGAANDLSIIIGRLRHADQAAQRRQRQRPGSPPERVLTYAGVHG